MTRRPDLPGIDSLFGSTAKQPSAPLPQTPEANEQTTDPVEVSRQAPEPGGIDEQMRAGAVAALCEPSAALERAVTAAASVLNPPSSEVGAFLRWAVAAHNARSIVEVGCAGGVTGLWFLDGLQAQAIVTSVEPDEHVHKLAKAAYRDAGVSGQVRAIHADGSTVLPRLTDESYDVVLLQTGAAKLAGELADAVRMLRPGGLLIARGVLRGGAHAKANAQFVNTLAEHRSMTVAVLPLDDGVVVATKTA
ncbi:MAG: class I SAM-dependent methyltransferase [Nitriliruptoraceae bacterium]